MRLSLAQMNQKTLPPPPLTAPGDDRALVTAARRDPRAFGALYDRYAVPIYRYAYVRLRNVPAAEDAASQVFLKAMQALPQFRDGVFVAWLFRIAHNVVADALRRAPPTAPLEVVESTPAAGESLEEAAIRSMEQAAFYKALNDLPEEQRNVLEMTLAGFKGMEIAQMTGKTHAAVKMLRWRGVETIKQRVALEGFLGEVQE